MKKAKRRLYLGDINGIKPTSIEIDQPQAQADPTTERTAQLRKRAQELLAEQAEQERAAQERAAAVRRRIDAVRQQCETETMWACVLETVRVGGFTRERVLDGSAYELALKRFQEI
jgi:hypothetical protein